MKVVSRRGGHRDEAPTMNRFVLARQVVSDEPRPEHVMPLPLDCFGLNRPPVRDLMEIGAFVEAIETGKPPVLGFEATGFTHLGGSSRA